MRKDSLRDLLYWEERYSHGQTGWDIGYPSPALIEYVESSCALDQRILIPGAGNAHEAIFLFEKGYKNIFVLDVARQPLLSLKDACPSFPSQQILHQDFFEYMVEADNLFDLILEQTFFCAFDPKRREEYSRKCSELLQQDGKLAGVFWAQEMNLDSPPYGGNKSEYQSLFSPYFSIEKMEECYNSIKPREGRELFVILSKE